MSQIFLSSLRLVALGLIGQIGSSYGEEGLLVLARSGGRYDPLQLLHGKQGEFWGVNQCKLDEQESFHNHTIKGNFRSPRIDELKTYADVQLEVVVFNKFGDELLNVKGCKMKENSVDMQCADKRLKDVTIDQLDSMGGLRIFTPEGVLAAMFDSTYYFDNTTKKETVFIAPPGGKVSEFNAGYKGCFKDDVISQGTLQSQHSTVETCIRACKGVEYTAVSPRDTNRSCSCVKASLKKISDFRVKEDQCAVLCEGNINQTCGGVNSTGLYDTKEYTKFKKLTQRPQKLSQIIKLQFNDTGKLSFPLKKLELIGEVKIQEDEECNLTNIFFNVSAPRYKLTFCPDGRCQQKRTFEVSGRGKPWHLGYIKAKVIEIEPMEHNCTFHRASFSFFGVSETSRQQGLFEISPAYVGIKGKWLKEVPQSTDTTQSNMEATMATTPTSTNTTEDPTETSATTKGAGTKGNNSDSLKQEQITVTSISTVNDLTGSPFASTTDSPSLDALSTSSFSTGSAQRNHSYQTEEKTGSTSTEAITSKRSSSPGPVTPTSSEPDLDLLNVTTPVPAVRQACTCLCKEKPLKMNQTKVMAAQEKAIIIQKKLKIDTMNLSSSVRKKVSAPDTRTTAAVGGYLGIVLLAISLGSLILADITSITRHIRLIRNRKPTNPKKKGK